ncbi:P-type conjugative transfer protein TrbJ [Tepidimonas charontis]|jgi:P-type conjugative transfer protein TrbJ|uniref:P-type conjugative transfer protein TrbJ n=1 Tax=Tepidimonas charontis TaxID=2267262 RepID=A0A554XH29_9BURK|nr:P-type conjugative transfer protein TrbJ [Tepidimonas charontis]TSE35135.1 P-type conjugative transfer protein TrbJ [Tepidimonas charontis]
MKKHLIAVLAASLAFTTVPARAGGAAGMATEFTQLANNSELIAIYGENVAQVQQLIQQYQNMIQNTLGLSTQMWPSIMVQISDLIDNIAAVDGAANASANALTQFASHYNDVASLNYAQMIQRWRTGVKNQIAESLRAAGLNANRMRDAQEALAEIQAASQSAQGRMQVLQAGNQIAGLMVNEIQSLHGTIIAAEQARQNFMATEIREKEKKEEAFREFWRDAGRRL